MIANLLSGKYHINTGEIIKFRVNIFMSVTKFPFLTISLSCKMRRIQNFVQFRGLFKETNRKNWEFCVPRKKGREKTNG